MFGLIFDEINNNLQNAQCYRNELAKRISPFQSYLKAIRLLFSFTMRRSSYNKQHVSRAGKRSQSITIISPASCHNILQVPLSSLLYSGQSPFMRV